MIQNNERCLDPRSAGSRTDRVLVVEDDDGLRNLIQRALGKAGYVVDGVPTGAAAIGRIKVDPGLVLLLDQKLTDMTGSELIAALAERKIRVPFVVMTGQGSERLAVEMMKLGAVDYLVKTLDLVDLLPGVFDRLFRELETERQLHVAETALRESERQLREMFDDAPIGYHELDAAGRIIRVNHTELALLGYSDREMLGRRVWEFVEEREVSRRAVLDKLAGTLPAGREVERSYRKKDGTGTPVLIQDLILRDKAGGISGIRTTVQSISARKQAEEDLQRFFESIPDLVCIVTTDGRFRKINPVWSATLGYSEQKILATSFYDFIHPDDRAATMKEVARRLGGEPTGQFTNRYRCEDGSHRWLEWRMTPAVDRTLLFASARDITDRKQAEEALQESNKRLEDITFSLAEWVWETDEKGVYTYSSQQGFTYFGPHREDVIGKTPFDFMPPDEAKRVGAIFVEAMARKAPVKDLENWNITKNGERICLLTNGTPILDENGNLQGYRGVNKDITAQRASENTLRLRGAALEAAANAIVITDRQGIVEWANPAFASLSGWSLGEAIGRNPRDLVKSGKHDAGFYRQMWDTLLAGKVWHGEIINRRKEGALRTEEMTITPLRGEQGDISHFIAIKQDITDHKMMQAHFLQAQRMEAIGTLAGGIAHDLNNILAPIMMVTGLVSDKLTDEGDRELLAMTHASALRGREVIKQLLIFSRGQAGERKVLQPRHLITEMGLMMCETFPREIKVQQQLPAVLWMICADPTQVHQVLLNLCVNARDAMPDGGQLTVGAANVTLIAGSPRVPPRAKPGPHVVITVSDTGRGIPPEIKHRIFDPFFSTKPVGQGTGLGLSTVLGIVHSHGGFVDVDSTPNEGTTFKVYFPANPDEGEAVAKVLVAPAVPRTGDETILVVDDERTGREMTRVLLERQHYRVLTAVNGEDALVQYLGHRTEITLVLTDLMMPVMSGVNLIRALRVIAPALKIIAMSGLTETVEAEKLAALGVSDVLTKPCIGSTLLEAVQHRLAGGGGGLFGTAPGGSGGREWRTR